MGADHTIMQPGEIDRGKGAKEAPFDGRSVNISIVHRGRILNEKFFRALGVVRMIMHQVSDEIAVLYANHFVIVQGDFQIFNLEKIAFGF